LVFTVAILKLKRPKLRNLDVPTLERLVRDNEKQRFKLISEPDGEGKPELWIRANQGHSLVVGNRVSKQNRDCL
jgi:RNA:NAD 2'-phosphotransferase (TPT1/KptA family)